MDKEILSVEASVKETGLQTQNFSKKGLKGTRIFCIHCTLLVAYSVMNPVNIFNNMPSIYPDRNGYFINV